MKHLVLAKEIEAMKCLMLHPMASLLYRSSLLKHSGQDQSTYNNNIWWPKLSLLKNDATRNYV
jgi:hypothetical protein